MNMDVDRINEFSDSDSLVRTDTVYTAQGLDEEAQGYSYHAYQNKLRVATCRLPGQVQLNKITGSKIQNIIKAIHLKQISIEACQQIVCQNIIKIYNNLSSQFYKNNIISNVRKMEWSGQGI